MIQPKTTNLLIIFFLLELFGAVNTFGCISPALACAPPALDCVDNVAKLRESSAAMDTFGTIEDAVAEFSLNLAT